MANEVDQFMSAVAGDPNAFSSPPPGQRPSDGQSVPEGVVTGDEPSFFDSVADPGGDETYFGVPLEQIRRDNGFGDDADPGQPPAAPAPPQGTPSQEKPPVDPELQDLRNQLEQYRAMIPVMEQIYRDPKTAVKVFEVLEESRGGHRPAEPQVQAPTPPEAPPDYSKEMAYSDPASSSWQYREKMEQYHRDVADYKVALAEQKLKQIEQIEQRREADMQNQYRQQMQYQDALARGATPQEAANYVQFLTSQQVDADMLWQLYNLKKGGALAQPRGSSTIPPGSAEPTNPVRERSQRLNYPVPPSRSASNGAVTKSPRDAIFDTLLDYTRGSNPFRTNHS